MRSKPKGLASFAPKKREKSRSTTVGGGELDSSSLGEAARGTREEGGVEVDGRRKAWTRRGRRTRRGRMRRALFLIYKGPALMCCGGRVDTVRSRHIRLSTEASVVG